MSVDRMLPRCKAVYNSITRLRGTCIGILDERDRELWIVEEVLACPGPHGRHLATMRAHFELLATTRALVRNTRFFAHVGSNYAIPPYESVNKGCTNVGLRWIFTVDGAFRSWMETVRRDEFEPTAQAYASQVRTLDYQGLVASFAA